MVFFILEVNKKINNFLAKWLSIHNDILKLTARRAQYYIEFFIKQRSLFIILKRICAKNKDKTIFVEVEKQMVI